MSAHTHALEFLIPIDPHGSLPMLAKRILEAARSDQAAHEALQKIVSWIDGQVTTLHEAGLLNNANIPVGGALYIRAIERLKGTAAVMPSPFAAMERQLCGIPPVLAALEDDFLQSLLGEIERRAYRDS